MKAWLFSAALLLVNSTVWSLAWLQGVEVAQENGAMENLQAGCLGLGSVILLVWAARAREKPAKLLLLGLGLLYLTFFMRELELERGGAFDVLAFLAGSEVRNVWLTAAWLGAAVLFLFRARATSAAFLTWVRQRPGLLLIAGGLLFAAADLFDKSLIPVDPGLGRFLEELLESNAALLMLESAVRCRSLRSRMPNAATREAIAEARNGGTRKVHATAEEMTDDILDD